MILNDIHRGVHKNRSRKRIGRGSGSGHGKTSGRGSKGYGSRSGSSQRVGFEGGQMPLARRMAKRGFNNKNFAVLVAAINVSALERVFEDGATVRPQDLVDRGLAQGRFEEIKILGNGQLTKKLMVQAHRFSKSAEEKITAAGGTVERV